MHLLAYYTATINSVHDDYFTDYDKKSFPITRVSITEPQTITKVGVTVNGIA